ncbi:MAG: SLBB domain-containing protein [Verrucomicrobiota bacterium]
MKTPVLRFVLLILMTAGVFGCASHLGPRFDPRAPAKKGGVPADFQTVSTGKKIPADLLKPPKEVFKLGVSDKLDIEIMQETGSRQECRVMPDGNLYFNALHGVQAAGLTVPELKVKLETGLKEMYRNPQVSIILRGVSSQRVWVLGRVNTPGLYPIDGPMTVLEAISKAGGLFSSRFSGSTEELADLHHSFLVRNGEFVPVDFYRLLREGDSSQNIYLRNGDYIYLPSSLSQEVYILGAVKQPKAIGFSDQVTLVSAISGAKGLLPNAYSQRIIIVRGSLASPKVATVNLVDILAGKQPDVLLEPRDIVWIPNSPWDRIEQYTNLVINTFVRTVAANAGGQAAVPSSVPVQSNISIGVGAGAGGGTGTGP